MKRITFTLSFLLLFAHSLLAQKPDINRDTKGQLPASRVSGLSPSLTKIITLSTYGSDGSSGFYPSATMNNGSKNISINSVWATSGLKAGAHLLMSGAGVAGADLSTTVTGYSAGVITVQDAASTTATSRGVWWISDNNTSGDDAAFTAALNECATISGCTIYVPPGTYVFTSTVTTPSNNGILSGAISIECQGGRYATRLVGAIPAGTTASIISTPATNSRPLRIKGCGFDTFDPVNRPNIAVSWLSGAEHWAIDNYFVNVQNGLNLCGVFTNEVHFNRFYQTASDNIKLTACNSSNVNYTNISDNEFGGTFGWAVNDVAGGDHNTIAFNDCEGTAKNGCFYLSGTYDKVIGNRQENDNIGGGSTATWAYLWLHCVQFSEFIGNTIGPITGTQFAMQFDGTGSCAINHNHFYGNQFGSGSVAVINVLPTVAGALGNTFDSNTGLPFSGGWASNGTATVMANVISAWNKNGTDGDSYRYDGFIFPNSAAQVLSQRKSYVFQLEAPNGGNVAGLASLNSGSAPVNRRQPSAASGAVYAAGDIILDSNNGVSSGLDPHGAWVCTGNVATATCTYNGSAWTGGILRNIPAHVYLDFDCTAAPTTGTWSVGDRCKNTAPAETGSAGSKYVIDGWVCTAAGTPGTWLPQRTLTGN